MKTIEIKTADEIRAEMKRAINLMEENKGFEYLSKLYARWLDEKGFEDFNEYKDAIKKNLSYFQINKITKKPFGIQYRFGNYQIIFNIKVKGNYFNMQCVAKKI